jgi:membrane protein DedA with SNARE-associated domain
VTPFRGPLLPLLFVYVVLGQLGVPLPVIPVLVPAGALAGAGKVPLATVVGIAVVAAVMGDAAWYALGRWRGTRVLAWLCRISLEPDSCVRRTEAALGGRGPVVLLWARFVPGLSTVAPPVAGMVGISILRFLAWDAAGALLWAGSWIATGWLLRSQAPRFLALLSRFGGPALGLFFLAVAVHLAIKVVRRQRFLRRLRIDRIDPDELRRRLDAGEDVTVVDLRHGGDAEKATVPGARRLQPETLDGQLADVPRDRELVLFCT